MWLSAEHSLQQADNRTTECENTTYHLSRPTTLVLQAAYRAYAKAHVRSHDVLKVASSRIRVLLCSSGNRNGRPIHAVLPPLPAVAYGLHN